MIRISTVTPVYAGENYLEKLVSDLDQLRIRINHHSDGLTLAESIFVVDGAIDESESVLGELSRDRPWVRVVVLARNYGQHNATVAGILHSSGDWVVTLDEDLQHPPKQILEMLAKAAEVHADVVLAVPNEGPHGNSYRDNASKLAKKLVGVISRNEYISQFSSFRLIRGQVARAAASVCSHETYFDVAMLWFTSRISTLAVDLKDERFVSRGSSGYSIMSLLSHAKRLIISSDVQFFKLAVLISGSSFLAAVLLELWVLLSYMFGPGVSDTSGWASLMSVNLFYGGVLSLLVGFILEVVRVNMFHSQGKPTFFVVDRDSDNRLASEVRAVLSAATELGA